MFSLIFRFSLAPRTQIKNKFTFGYGKNLDSKVNRVEFEQSIALKENKEKQVVGAKFDNRFYVGMVPLTVELNGESDRKLLKFDFSANYDDLKAKLEVQHKINQKARGDYDLKVTGSVKDTSITLYSARSIEPGDKSKLINKLESSFGVRVELNGLVGHKFTYKDADVNLQGIFQTQPNQDTYKATVFIQNNEKESNSNFKFGTAKVDYATYEGKIVNGKPTSTGKFKLMVLDVTEAEADFTVTGGKGEASAVAELKKDGRKLKALTAFTVQKPTYDVSVDFFYDYERDNTKTAQFATQNKVTKSSFDSKNRMELFQEKFAFNVAGSQTGTLKDGVIRGESKRGISDFRPKIFFSRKLLRKMEK